jgi:hypothetical protein
MVKPRRPTTHSRRTVTTKRRKKTKLSITAISQKSGISHTFNDLDALQALAKSYISKRNSQFETDLVQSLRLWNWIKAQPPIQPNFLIWTSPIYRVVFGGFNPLSVTGSLATGGRFNLGGAQILEDDLFPGIQMGACLYGATSAECARIEGGSFLQNAEMHQIIPKNSLKLWKLEEVLQNLSDPSLLDIVRKAPMSKRWVLQKTPLFSQLISTHLRSIGGDGVIFPSTKLSSENVIAFFIKDDAQAQTLFKTNPIS